MGSKLKVNRKELNIWVISIFTLLISGIAFFTILGNIHFGDEGWYSYDIYQVFQGKQPYQDFFYHRLPLFIEFYGLICKVIGISLLKLRAISGILSIIVFIATYIFIRRNIGGNLGLIGGLLLMTGFDVLKYYTTIQSYALVALCLLIAVFIAKAKIRNIIKFPLIGILMVFTQWLRFPVSYILIAYIIFLVFYNYKDWKVLLLSILCFAASHITLFIIYDSPEFRFDIVYMMSQVSTSFLAKLLTLKGWLFSIFKSYFAISVVLLVLLIEHFKIYSIKTTVNKIIKKEWLVFCLLLILGNFSFYTLTYHLTISMAYVLPLIVISTVYLLKVHFYSFSRPLIKNAFFIFVIIFAIIGTHGRGLYSYRFENSHINIMNDIGQKIESITNKDDKLLVFGSLFGFVSKREIIRGLEFDLYGLRHSFSMEEVEKYYLMNEKKLLSIVNNKEADVIIVNDRLLNPTGMGKVLEEVRETFLELVDNNYSEVNIDDRNYERIIGTLRLYEKKKRNNANDSMKE